MKIHEYQAKELFKKYGIAVPGGAAAFSPEEARALFERFGKNAGVMVKAQVLAGGRGKSGGIQKASNPDEAQKAAASLIGKTFSTYQSAGRPLKIRAVLIEERCAFTKELYLGAAVDRFQGLPVLIFSEEGGVDIEEVARKTPEKVLKIRFDPDRLDETAFAKALKPPVAEIALKLARAFVKEDCQLAEINPLVLTEAAPGAASLLALDAKIVFDENAAFRHPEWEALRDPDEETETERRAKKAGLSFISLDGNIGCMVNGAGLAMATMDIVKAAGGDPANFLDVGGGADKARVLEAFHILLENPGVQAIFVNIFGGITHCDVIAEALVEAAREIGIRVPIVVRLEGTRVEEARKILSAAPIELHTAKTIQEGAEAAVKLVKKDNVHTR